MSDIASAIKAICDEKGLSYDAVLGTIESALAAAYRKDYGKKNQNIVVEFKPETGKSRVFDIKTVVEDMPEEEEEEHETEGIEEKDEDKKEKKQTEKDNKKEDKNKKEEKDKNKDKNKEEVEDSEKEEVKEERKFNPKTEIQVSDAKMIKKTAKVGSELKMKLEVPEAYGRMAAQTAKQVIIQRLREAEREMIYNDFKDKEKEVVSGIVQRREGNLILVDLGKSVGVLPMDEQIRGERYNSGERIKVYVKEVNLRPKGPEIILSRTSDEILKKVFYLEIPEISNGLIELKNVAREAGSRSKVAVIADSDNVDPIGSCVGQRGARIQTIIAELGGEKVDIIEYSDEPITYISNALSPAKISSIDIDEKSKKATVKVISDQLSLAIGKGGQNARLAAKLTGWKIDIVGADDEAKEDGDKEEKKKNKPAETEEQKNESVKEEKENDVGGSKSKAKSEKKKEKIFKKDNKKEDKKEEGPIDDEKKG